MRYFSCRCRLLSYLRDDYVTRHRLLLFDAVTPRFLPRRRYAAYCHLIYAAYADIDACLMPMRLPAATMPRSMVDADYTTLIISTPRCYVIY